MVHFDSVPARSLTDTLQHLQVTALETALGHCVREFENERGLLSARTDERTADIQV
jgi:hypothetical protein